MSAGSIDGFAMRRFTLSPSLAPTGAGEGSAELSLEASHSDQQLCSTECSVRPSTGAGEGDEGLLG